MDSKDYGVFGEALAAAEIGTWKIEIDDGKEPRMYADATMRKLIGLAEDANLTPEETYRAWHDRIDHGHRDAVAEGVAHMMKCEMAEIQYPWHHPDGRTIVVRCGGVRDPSYTAGARVAGIHQWVTTMKHVDRELEANEQQLRETLAALENANLHERLKADALAFILKNSDLEEFVEFFSGRILELYGCDQVIYRDVEGRMILKDKPGTRNLDFSLCENCPHFAFDAPVYEDGFTAMDDCAVGYKGVPVHPDCQVRASLTYLVYEEERIFGYIALHYLGQTHHFSENEKKTFDSMAKFMSMVLSRRKHQEGLKESLAFTNYFIDTFVATYYVNLETHVGKIYSRTDRLAHDYPDVSEFFDALNAYADRDVHPDDREEFRAFVRPEHIKALLREKRMAVHRFRDISGGVEKVYGLRIVRGADENSAAIACADLTEESRKDLELEEKNARFEVVKKLIHSGLWNFRVNARDELIGVELSEDIPKLLKTDRKVDLSNPMQWLDLVHPDDRPAAIAAFKATIADHTGRTPYDVIYRMVDRDGNYNWFHSAGSVIRHADGSGDFFGIHIDISKTIEKEREQQKQLEEALAMAQAANRAKTMFLNNMSHDIRTPMNAIIGFTGLAASHIDSKALVQDYLTKIGQSSDHLLSLINDVLDMARIESGKMNLNEKSESLPEIVHALRNIIQSQVADKQLDFFIDCCDVKDETVVCDKLRLSQVLLNVLSNAIKYTPAGGMVSLRISEKGKVKGEKVQTARYVFTIKDNGVGISPEFLKEIFDPFARAKNSTASGVQGTGLGMAITKNIVDMMGGEVDVRSEVGKGTEVTIVLDFALGESAAVNPRIEALAGLPALVADDDVNSCLSVSATLEEIGMRPEWCTSGKEAVIRAKTAFGKGDAFRVYIIDWLMPDMNGIETVRRIRKVIGDDMPIIILTAYDWSDIEEEALEAGVTAFIAKPLFASELHRVLVEQVGENGGQRSKVKGQTAEDKHHCLTSDLKPLTSSSTVRHILLVEDNEINREIAVIVLTEQGFDVDFACNGAEAVEKVKQANDPGSDSYRYDFVLMDIQMPVMNGYDAARAIRAWEEGQRSKVKGQTEEDKHHCLTSDLQPSTSRIPIVALSANAFAEDVTASLEAGMDGHLAKPIKIKELMDCIEKFGPHRNAS